MVDSYSLTSNGNIYKMLSPNHLIGGFVFTGVFGALAGQNMLESPTNLVSVLFCSQLPDIDHLRSPISWICKPVSRYISRRYGHRTITHSVFALAFVCLVAWLLGLNAWLCGLSYFSHILFDMMTVQGVPFMYPVSKSIVVIPGNPKLRFRTGDTKTEVMIFGVFSALSVFTFPLAKNGFWTTYNNSFGTIKTLHSEFTKSKDLLEVNYLYSIGSVTYQGKGYCIESQENDCTLLLENGSFLKLNNKDMVIKNIQSSHTQKKFEIKKFDFLAVSIDSLNALIQNKKILELELISNQTAQYTEGGITHDFRTLKKDYPNTLFFSVKDSHIVEKPFFNLPSVTSKLKRQQIQSIRDEYNDKKRQYDNTQIEIQNLIADTATDYIKRERIMKRIQELKTEKPPELDIYRIRNLEYEALISEQQETLQTQIEYQKYLLEQSEKRKGVHDTVLSGLVRYIIMM